MHVFLFTVYLGVVVVVVLVVRRLSKDSKRESSTYTIGRTTRHTLSTVIVVISRTTVAIECQ